MRKERATGTQSKKEAGNIPGKQDDIAHCQDFQCGCFRVIDTDRSNHSAGFTTLVLIQYYLLVILPFKQIHASNNEPELGTHLGSIPCCLWT